VILAAEKCGKAGAKCCARIGSFDYRLPSFPPAMTHTPKQKRGNGFLDPKKATDRAVSWTKWSVMLFLGYWLCVFLDGIKVGAIHSLNVIDLRYLYALLRPFSIQM